jgi:flagellar basal-body rod modification protein FlgD
MSAITSTLLNNQSSAASGSATSSTNTAGMNLTPTDFIKMMVTQLQNQDPLNPTSDDQLLSQMSEIGQLQSSTQLQTSLQSMVLQNQISSAGNLIGKYVQGMDSQGNTQKGTVNSVQVKSGGIFLELDNNQELSMSNVTSILSAPPAAAATTGTTGTTSTAATTAATTNAANSGAAPTTAN